MLPEKSFILVFLGYLPWDIFILNLVFVRTKGDTTFFIEYLCIVPKKEFIMGMCCLHKRGEEGVNMNGHVQFSLRN